MRWIGMSIAPLMLTMLIPIFLIKEPPSYIITFQNNKKVKELTKDVKQKEEIGFFESIKITLGNHAFLI
jgi:hypothetical protein